MTIDERLERLAERHEGLAQTVEMLAVSVPNLERLSEANEGRVDRLTEQMANLMDTMNRLGNIVIAHEDRIGNVEERLDDIERGQ